MTGTFTYGSLLTRIQKIRQLLDEETQSWIIKGQKAYEMNEGVASNLKSQFEQCLEYFSKNPNGVTLTLEIEKDNPFIWTIVPSPT